MRKIVGVIGWAFEMAGRAFNKLIVATVKKPALVNAANMSALERMPGLSTII